MKVSNSFLGLPHQLFGCLHCIIHMPIHLKVMWWAGHKLKFCDAANSLNSCAINGGPLSLWSMSDIPWLIGEVTLQPFNNCTWDDQSQNIQSSNQQCTCCLSDHVLINHSLLSQLTFCQGHWGTPCIMRSLWNCLCATDITLFNVVKLIANDELELVP